MLDTHASRTSLSMVATLVVASIFVAQSGQGADSAPPVLRTLTIVPEVASIEEGATQPYVAIGTYSDNVRKDLTIKAKWSSSNRKLSTMTAGGTAKGIKSGKVTIMAAIGTLKATGKLTIEPRLISISVASPEMILVPGEGYAFTVLGRYSDGSVRLLTDKTSWTVDDEGVATIDATGIAMAVKRGTVTIVAAVRDLRARAQLRIGDAITPAVASRPMRLIPQETIETPPAAAPARSPYLQSISIESTTDSLPTGQARQLTAEARYSDGAVRDITSEAVWSSSDVQVARAGLDGSVVGVNAGIATITATLDTVSGASTLTVTPTISSIAIDPGTLSIKHHASGRLSAIATLTDGTKRDITAQAAWTSDNDAVASVSVGSISGNAPGSASITAILDAFRASASITVEPVIQSISISPSSASLQIGQTAAFTASCTYSDGSTSDVTNSATWNTSDASVASVSGSGTVTAVGSGSATIGVSIGSASAMASVTVAAPPPDANPPRRRVAPH